MSGKFNFHEVRMNMFQLSLFKIIVSMYLGDTIAQKDSVTSWHAHPTKVEESCYSSDLLE